MDKIFVVSITCVIEPIFHSHSQKNSLEYLRYASLQIEELLVYHLSCGGQNNSV